MEKEAFSTFVDHLEGAAELLNDLPAVDPTAYDERNDMIEDALMHLTAIETEIGHAKAHLEALKSKKKTKKQNHRDTMRWHGGMCYEPKRRRTGCYVPRFQCDHGSDCPSSDAELVSEVEE